MSKITGYSHYHPEAMSMVGSPINQAVLLYLICRYQEKVKNGHKDQPFSVSANKIATEKNMSWRSVKQSLELYQKRGLIEIEDSYCYFNESIYWKYLHKFQALPFTDRANFSTKFVDPKISNEEFNKYPEMDSDALDSFEAAKGRDVMQNVRTLCKISEPSDICQNPMQNITTPELVGLCKMLEGYDKCQNLLKNVISVCIKISCAISQNYSEKELEELLKDYLDVNFDISAIASDILHNSTEFTPEKLLLLAVLGSDILQKGLCKMSEGVMQNVITTYAKCHNRYNMNRDIKINEPSNENVDEEADENEEPCMNFQDPLPIVELKGAETVDELPVSKESVYPFLPVEQVEEIVNNIEVAKQSSFRLFLFNLWGYASDMTNEGYDQCPDEEDEQEPFSETEEEFFDPEGCLITRSDYRQLLLESYEQTQADIEKGEMEYGNETLSLSLTEMFPRNLLFKILDWKETAMSCKESSVIISKAGIRNIEAEELSSVEQPKTREEKRQAAKEGRELMIQLHATKQDNNLYSQLTPIEKIAADIVEDYFQPNPDKESRDPFVFRSRNILTKDEWRVLKFQMVKAGVKVSEFLSCLLNNDGPNDGDQLSLQMPMFYAEGIRHWNVVHQETSVL